MKESFKQTSHYRNYVEYIVIWYGSIINSNNRKNSSKLVDVFLSNMKGNFIIKVQVPLEVIPQMPIGSIWKNGKSQRKISLTKYRTVIQENLNNNEETNFKHLRRTEEINRKFFTDFDNLYNFPLSNDYNTLIVKNDENENLTFIIHPLNFFNAHYGVSKQINRILLTYFWEDPQHPNSKSVSKMLELDYYNPNSPSAVFIPNNLTIGDAVFLYHLRNDEYSLDIVRNLNARVLSNFFNNANKAKAANPNNLPPHGYSFLKISPYHNQPIYLEFEGLRLGENLVLCTNITGISLPIGEPVLFDIEGSINYQQTNMEQGSTQSVKPLIQNLELEEIL